MRLENDKELAMPRAGACIQAMQGACAQALRQGRACRVGETQKTSVAKAEAAGQGKVRQEYGVRASEALVSSLGCVLGVTGSCWRGLDR